MQTVPVPTDEITFESFTTLTAIAALTRRVRLGHVVLCAPFRNAALTGKMISTLDVISGGRAELGLGAGWKEDEFRGYGYPYPETKERLAILRETLEIATRMLGPGHATYQGAHLRVDDAINVPKGLQSPRVPIMVGGNGPNVTWRLAARFADELNLDWMKPPKVADSLPVIHARCEGSGPGPPEPAHLGQHRSGLAGARGTGPGRPPGGLPRAGRGPGHGPAVRIGGWR